jgi:uncharacterized membrane protein
MGELALGFPEIQWLVPEGVMKVIADMNVPEIASRSLHLFAAIMAVGGAIFIRRILNPNVRRSLTADGDQNFIDTLVRRCSILVYVSILVIVITGFWNMAITLSQHAGQTKYHMIFGIKVILAIVLMTLAIILASTKAAKDDGRKRRSWAIPLSIVIAATIVLLSNILKQFPDI